MITGCLAKNSGTGECSNKKVHGFCTRHYKQYLRGMIDAEGSKLRDFLRRRPTEKYMHCIALGKNSGRCSSYKGGRWCSRHHGLFYEGNININGEKIKEFKSYHPECLAKDSDSGECSAYRKGSKFCIKHYKQVKYGIIDSNGKKIRDHKKRPPIFLTCIVHDIDNPCSKFKKGRGRFCGKHKWQYEHEIIDKQGIRLRGRIKRFKKCLAEKSGTDCGGSLNGRFCTRHWHHFNIGVIDKKGNKMNDLKREVKWFDGCQGKDSITGACSPGYVLGERFCARHAWQRRAGIIDKNGTKLRILTREIVCGISGCNKPGGRKWGLCQYHYDRIIVRDHLEDILMPETDDTMRINKVRWNDIESNKGGLND